MCCLLGFSVYSFEQFHSVSILRNVEVFCYYVSVVKDYEQLQRIS